MDFWQALLVNAVVMLSSQQQAPQPPKLPPPPQQRQQPFQVVINAAETFQVPDTAL